MNHDTSVNNYHLVNSKLQELALQCWKDSEKKKKNRVQLGRPTALCSNIAVEKSSGRQKKLKISKVVVRKDHDLGISPK